jgi:rSAM/selenodomain-associated transferase 2
MLETLLAVFPLEQIVVSDGNSRDGTAELCARNPVTVVQSAPGRGRQLNAGAAAATGDVYFFLHADTVPEGRVRADIGRAVAEGHSWGCCTVAFDDDAPFFRAVGAASNRRSRQRSMCFGDQGIFCTAELFRKVGGFPDIPLMEDVELSRRLRWHERAFVVQGRIVTSARRFHEGGPVRTLLAMQGLKALYAVGVAPQRLARLYGTGRGERS